MHVGPKAIVLCGLLAVVCLQVYWVDWLGWCTDKPRGDDDGNSQHAVIMEVRAALPSFQYMSSPCVSFCSLHWRVQQAGGGRKLSSLISDCSENKGSAVVKTPAPFEQGWLLFHQLLLLLLWVVVVVGIHGRILFTIWSFDPFVLSLCRSQVDSFHTIMVPKASKGRQHHPHHQHHQLTLSGLSLSP